MSAHNRQPSMASSMTKGQSSASENSGSRATAAKPQAEKKRPVYYSGKEATAAKLQLDKKRPALTNITNRINGPKGSASTAASTTTLVPCKSKTAKARKGSSACLNNTSLLEITLPSTLNANSSFGSSCEDVPYVNADKPIDSVTAVDIFRDVDAIHFSFSAVDASPTHSEEGSVSLDETMSTCDSLRSPEFECIDNADASVISSVERKTFNHLYISEHSEVEGTICKRSILLDSKAFSEVVNVDDKFGDPQQCAGIACDVYEYLRVSETKKRPSPDFMERVQKDINATMRAILIDWLVEVAEEYRLVPETLFLTVNYIDRYLSVSTLNRKKLQLLGVSCMMIAAKYEEICAPRVQDFCYITDNTYFKEEVLQMESEVLNSLKFEMTTPTVKCFLRRFVRAAQGSNEVPSLLLECLANYIAELSLLEYSMLCYAPSLIAASATFLAKFILLPSKRPWNSTLWYYTLYCPSDMRECISGLHRLCRDGQTLPAIREKYSQHKYKFVAKKYCPPSIPQQFFHDHCQ